MPQRYHDLRHRARPTITSSTTATSCWRPFSDKAHEYAAKVAEREGRRPPARRHRSPRSRPIGSCSPTASQILSRCVVWAGGLKARAIEGLEVLPNVAGSHQPSGRTSASRASPGVYAVGDGPQAIDPTATPYPQLGSVALQAGEAVADSILADIDGKPAPSFNYHDKGIMAMIGRRCRRRRDGQAPPRAPRPGGLRRLARRARLAAEHHPRPHRRLHELGLGLVLQQPRPRHHRRPRRAPHRLGRRRRSTIRQRRRHPTPAATEPARAALP